jgi:putative inorganic carbon (hco3(-)) transporter
MVWVLAASVGFYGIKGGLFVLATGGAYKVFGPDQTFIGDNNAMALALVMAVPLLRYLQLHSVNKWAKRGCLAGLVLCVISALGSYSRGALLALLAMGVFLWVKGKNRGVMLLFAALALPLISFMPDEWMDRMNTIKDYDEDRSALGRISAWWMAWNLARDRFPIGGGFEIWSDSAFAKYSPTPEFVHAAHSIYFQVLGEHGFVGLFLFLCIFFAAFLTGSSIIRLAKAVPELVWAVDLAKMCQVSLIAFAVGGAFLSLSYYDFPYYIAAVMVVLKRLVVASLPVTQRGALHGPQMQAPVVDGR